MPIKIKNKQLYRLLLILSITGAVVAAFSTLFFLKYNGDTLPYSIGWMFFSILVLLFFLMVIFKVKKDT